MITTILPLVHLQTIGWAVAEKTLNRHTINITFFKNELLLLSRLYLLRVNLFFYYEYVCFLYKLILIVFGLQWGSAARWYKAAR